MGITIVGLGPGNGRLLTREAWEILVQAGTVYLRTGRHPAVDDLPGNLQRVTFDHLYESADSFADVYARIVEELLALGAEREIVYAVPGHPHVGEATVLKLEEAAAARDLTLRIVPGVSFVEPLLTAVGLDALDGVQLFDALQLIDYLYPPVNSDVPLLVGQVYSRLVASEIKLLLMNAYPDEHPVTLVHAAGEPDQIVERVPLYAIDRSAAIDHLTSLYVPPLPFAASLEALAETVAVLRSPDGCPWDQEQTPQSMREGFLEEAYEVLSALDAGDPVNLREELGDMLYHLVMQAQMAAEAGEFTLSDVVAGIEAKLKRRHPHVWGDWEVADTAEVLRNWETLKQQEKASQPDSLLDGVPEALPALARAQKIQQRVARTGFDWPGVDPVYDKVAEELAELHTAVGDKAREAELGDLLHAVVNLARHLRIDAESALREASLRFVRRFRTVEQIAAERGLPLSEQDPETLLAMWDEARNRVSAAPSDS